MKARPCDDLRQTTLKKKKHFLSLSLPSPPQSSPGAKLIYFIFHLPDSLPPPPRFFPHPPSPLKSLQGPSLYHISTSTSQNLIEETGARSQCEESGASRRRQSYAEEASRTEGWQTEATSPEACGLAPSSPWGQGSKSLSHARLIGLLAVTVIPIDHVFLPSPCQVHVQPHCCFSVQ